MTDAQRTLRRLGGSSLLAEAVPHQTGWTSSRPLATVLAILLEARSPWAWPRRLAGCGLLPERSAASLRRRRCAAPARDLSVRHRADAEPVRCPCGSHPGVDRRWHLAQNVGRPLPDRAFGGAQAQTDLAEEREREGEHGRARDDPDNGRNVRVPGEARRDPEERRPGVSRAPVAAVDEPRSRPGRSSRERFPG